MFILLNNLETRRASSRCLIFLLVLHIKCISASIHDACCKNWNFLFHLKQENYFYDNLAAIWCQMCPELKISVKTNLKNNFLVSEQKEKPEKKNPVSLPINVNSVCVCLYHQTRPRPRWSIWRLRWRRWTRSSWSGTRWRTAWPSTTSHWHVRWGAGPEGLEGNGLVEQNSIKFILFWCLFVFIVLFFFCLFICCNSWFCVMLNCCQ